MQEASTRGAQRCNGTGGGEGGGGGDGHLPADPAKPKQQDSDPQDGEPNSRVDLPEQEAGTEGSGSKSKREWGRGV